MRKKFQHYQDAKIEQRVKQALQYAYDFSIEWVIHQNNSKRGGKAKPSHHLWVQGKPLSCLILLQSEDEETPNHKSQGITVH